MLKTLTLAALAVVAIAGAAIAPAHAYKGCCDWGEPNGTSLTGTTVAAPAGQIETVTLAVR